MGLFAYVVVCDAWGVGVVWWRVDSGVSEAQGFEKEGQELS